MLINFSNHNIIVRNFFSKDKTVVFLLIRDENISERLLEKLLTLYLMKCDIINDENEFKTLHIFLYINNHLHISSVDKGLFKKIYFYYDGCIHIKKIHEADNWVKKYFLSNVYDFSTNISIQFDKQDYNIYRRIVKRTKRLQRLKSGSSIRKSGFISNFLLSLFGTKKNNDNNLTLQLQS